MQLPHPQHPTLKIIVGEKAKAGAWFVPSSGQTMSQIANQAYSSGVLAMVLRINKSKWNRDNLIYRRESTNCASPKVNSTLALSQSSFAPGAWVALCQQDTPSWAMGMGFPFPPVWIPGLHGEEPSDFASSPEIVNLAPGFGGDTEPPPTAVFMPGDPQEPSQPRQPSQGGFRWYHGLAIGGGVLAVVGIAWAASRKKRGG